MKHSKMPEVIHATIGQIHDELNMIVTRYRRAEAYLPLVEEGLNTMGLTVKRCFMPDDNGVTAVEVLPLKGGKFHYAGPRARWSAKHQKEIAQRGAEIEDAIKASAPGIGQVELNQYTLSIPAGMKDDYQPTILLAITF